MARDALSRNLRDGVLVISDGSATPKTLTLVLDAGDLSWTETKNTQEILDRGVLDHTRPGDQASCDVSFSAIWTQLIGATSGGGGGANELYEMLTNRASYFTSTSGTGEQFTLKLQFTIDAPGGTSTNDEVVTFNKVYTSSVQCQEGDPTNTLTFSGKDFETRPSIARGS